MSESRRSMLSIGVFFIIAVIAILLYATSAVTDWLNIFPIILVLYGVWMLVDAGMRTQNPQKYERSAVEMGELGVLLLAFGGAWLLWRTNWLYSVVVILFVLGAIAILASMRRSKKP